MYKNIINDNSDIYLKFGYLTFPLNLNIISKIKIGSEMFFSKSGYHISLLHLEGYPESEQRKICSFAQKYPIKLKKVTNIYRLVTLGDQQSIVVRVRLGGLKKLISAVNKHFGYSFVYPPTHITLFTLKGQFGIGVNSNSDYRCLTKKINPPDSLRLVKSFEVFSS